MKLARLIRRDSNKGFIDFNSPTVDVDNVYSDLCLYPYIRREKLIIPKTKDFDISVFVVKKIKCKDVFNINRFLYIVIHPRYGRVIIHESELEIDGFFLRMRRFILKSL